MCSSNRNDLQRNEYRVTIEEKEGMIYMGLLKKFWNTDIIGKIYILIILFIVVVATITVITRYRNKDIQTNNEKTSNNLVEQESTLEDIETTNEIDKEEIVQETKEKTSDNLNNNESKNVKKETKEDTKVTAILGNSNDKVNKKEKTEEQKTVTGQVEQEKIPEKKQEEPSKQEIKQEPVRTVKRNGDYIQKIKDYIETNDTSTYSIKEDASIVNTSSGFTYSEFNLSSYIGNYSTYRIYAQDYYVNGEYVETRCYID